jgi:hypothetical protein
MNTTLNQALSLVNRSLAQFANSPSFWSDFELAFGKNFDRLKAEQIHQSLVSSSFTRSIQVVQDQILGMASGAFAAVTNTVYLCESLLASGDLAHISEVIIEEYGHSIDSQVNKEETPGDEGAIFRLLVKGIKLSQAMLAELRAEDDWTVISINGQQLAVEMAVFNGAIGDDTLGGLIANDNIGNDLFYPLKGIDIIAGGSGTDTLIVDYSTSTNAGIVFRITNGILSDGEIYGVPDQITFTSIENFNITATQGADYLEDGNGNDTLNSGAGDDSIITLKGVNIINGGTGNDNIRANNGSKIDGGDGIDKLTLDYYTSQTVARITFNTATSGTGTDGTTFQNIEKFSFLGSNGNDYVDASLTNQEGYYPINGADGNDTFIGGAGTDVFIAGSGNSRLVGNAGNDSFLIYGTGADTLEGGAGNDEYLLDGDASAGISGGTVINDISGNDRISSPSIALDSGFSKSGNNLIVDISKDGRFNAPDDLTIIDFFSAAGGAGRGFIENFIDPSSLSPELSGAAVLNKFKPIRNDFNNDRNADILWRNTDGHVGLLTMNGSTILASKVVSPSFTDNSWQIAGTSDFNGDNKADILWRNANGSIGLWAMDGSNVLTTNVVAPRFKDNNWKIASIGDFNGDSKSDILWRNIDGKVGLWTMDGTNVLSAGTVAPWFADNAWTIAGTGDFNGDSKADILWRKSDGSVSIWYMDGSNILNTFNVAVNKDWNIKGIDDLDGNGTSDILWHKNDNTMALWRYNDGFLDTVPIDSTAANGQITGTGDFNKDGRADILWRATDGTVSIWQMDGANILSTSTVVKADVSWQVAAPII